ncbi:equilibrative nucleobase transporter 1-like isoform X2 [Penaeus chinensis]|uniref:equilibrative nucleobase transporter 1-like isoform X2 n=1 Tax=Penaeus chinensis TaxID=139456 RepID=UPI001FB6C103|nr:equilibrative nucleobase transporter 1-like isoform X2 [Penaeus chinensis]
MSSAPIGRYRRWCIFLVGLLESLLFGGTIFGWAQLAYVLKEQGIFSHLCNTTVTSRASSEITFKGCAAQDETFALIYTVACTLYSTPGILLGYMLHHLGLAVTRISGGLMLVTGFLCLGQVSKEAPAWLYPAMILLSLGGNQLRMSGLQFGNLFPRYRSTAISVISGVFSASAGLFFFLQLAVDAGISLRHANWVLAGMASLTLPVTIIMPCHHIPYNDDGAKVNRECVELPLRKSFLSLSSFTYQLWFFINLFSIVLFNTFFNSWISSISSTGDEAWVFSSLFSVSAFVSPFISPMPGFAMDLLKKSKLEGLSSTERRVQEMRSPALPSLVLTGTVAVMYSCLFFKTPAAVYLALVCLMLARPSVIAIGNSFVRARFPGDHFHRLIGIYGTIVSVLTILQYPHFLWAQHDYYGAQGFMMAMVVVSCVQPFHLLSNTYLRKVVHMEQTTLSSDEITVPLSSDVDSKKSEVVQRLSDPPQPA